MFCGYPLRLISYQLQPVTRMIRISRITQILKAECRQATNSAKKTLYSTKLSRTIFIHSFVFKSWTRVTVISPLNTHGHIGHRLQFSPQLQQLEDAIRETRLQKTELSSQFEILQTFISASAIRQPMEILYGFLIAHISFDLSPNNVFEILLNVSTISVTTVTHVQN